VLRPITLAAHTDPPAQASNPTRIGAWAWWRS